MSRPRSASKARPLQLLTLLLLAATVAACVSAPEPEDWYAAGAEPFRTPASAFRTYRTALAGDEIDLEYRCLSSSFKHANGLTQLAYREFRAQLLDEKPWVKYLAEAEVTGQREVGPDRVELTAEVHAFFQTYRLRIGCVRESFYDLIGPDFVDGKAVEFDELVRSVRTPRGDPGVDVSLKALLPPGRDASELVEVRVVREWKIASLELDDGESPPSP